MPSNEASVLHKTTLHVDQLIPNGSREDLKLDDYLINSVRENGVKIRLAVRPLTPDEEAELAQPGVTGAEGQRDGAAGRLPKYKILMGDRRHGAVKKNGLTEVPVYVVDLSARDRGEDYLEALIENDERGRKPLSSIDRALTMFRASEVGTSVEDMARRTILEEGEVHKAVIAGRHLSSGTRRRLTDECERQISIDELVSFAEFDDDPAAVGRLIAAHDRGHFEAQMWLEREGRVRAVQRKEFESEGVRLVEDLAEVSEGAAFVEDLYDAAELQLDPDDHRSCPGHALTWDAEGDLPEATVALCLDPDGNGHQREAQVPAGDGRGGADAVSGGVPPSSPPAVLEPAGLPYGVKVAGNSQWRAARQERRKWLVAFCGRKSAPKDLRPWVSGQLLACPKPVAKWEGDDARVEILAELLGRPSKEKAPKRARWVGSSPSAGRLALCDFAVIAASYEKRIEKVQTWRTDEPAWDSEAIRSDAQAYLKALVSFGYRPTLIEEAVIKNVPFDPAAGADDSTTDTDKA